MYFVSILSAISKTGVAKKVREKKTVCKKYNTYLTLNFSHMFNVNGIVDSFGRPFLAAGKKTRTAENGEEETADF